MLKMLMSFVGTGDAAAEGSPARRFVLGLAGTAAIALNHKAGLNLDPTELGILAGTVATIILGSSAKEAHQAAVDARVEAVKAVPNVDAAVSVLVSPSSPSSAVGPK